MISSLEGRLAGIEALIQEAARSSPTEIPSVLSQAVPALESACSEAKTGADRERLQSFQLRLKLFSIALQRGQAILQGYARHAGASLHEYGPAGAFDGVRDPSFFNLSV